MISDTTIPRQQYTLSTGTDALSFDFYILSASHLTVWNVPADGSEPALLVLDTDYSVDGTEDPEGNVTVTMIGQAAGDVVTVLRVPTMDQLLSLVFKGKIYEESLENGLDKLTMICLALQEQMNRALQYPPTETDGTWIAELDAAVDRASKMIEFDENGVLRLVASTSPEGIQSAIDQCEDFADQAGVSANAASTSAGNAATSEANAAQSAIDAAGFATVAASGARNVKDPAYGAVGDGVTDDTAAIQSALDLGGNIFIPEGVYMVADLTTPQDGTTIYGVGYKSVLKRRTDIDMIIAKRVLNINKGGAQYRSNVTVKDLRFDGSWSIGDPYTENECVNADNTENLTLTNLWIHNAGQDGIDLDGRNLNPVVTHNRVYDCAGNGIHTYGVINGNVSFNSISNVGIGWTNASGASRPSGLDFTPDPNTGLSTYERAPKDTKVFGNSIIGALRGIHLWDGFRMNVSGNVIRDIDGEGLEINSNYSTFDGNHVQDCRVHADASFGGEGIHIDGAFNQVIGGSVQDCESLGVRVYVGDDNIVSGVNVTGNATTYGMVVESNAKRNTVSNCRITNTSATVSALRVVGSDCVITGNNLKGGQGLNISSLANYITAIGNRLDGTQYDLFLPGGSIVSGVIKDNYLVNNLASGRADNVGTGVMLVGTTFTEVIHGLYKAPELDDISWHFTEAVTGPTHFWLSAGSTTSKFKINYDSAITGSGADFTWKASVNER